MKGKLVHTLILSTAKEIKKKTTDVTIKPYKSSPNYEEYFPKYKELEKPIEKDVNGKKVIINLKSFNDNLIIEAETEFDEKDIDKILDIKEILYDECQKNAKKYEPSLFFEEYTFYCISDYESYDKYISANRIKIASLLKDETIDLTNKEINETMSSNLKYGKEDTVIIDWDGTFILDKKKEFDDIISLIELANIQLLNLRILDNKLQDEIARIRKLIDFGKLKIFKLSSYIKDIIKLRSEALLELDSIENIIKLYGDWYSARLYNIAAKKMYIEKWRSNVEAKLNLLKEMYDMVSSRMSESYNIILEFTIVFLIILE